MSTPRRDFLSMIGVGGLAAATGPLHLPDVDGGGDPFVKNDKWDMTWIKRIRGKARGVFDIVTLESNGGWERVVSWHDQAIEVYGKRDEVNGVAVIRHGGIALAMNDAYWDEFKPGKPRGRGAAPDTTAATTAPAPPVVTRNPIGTPKPGATDTQKDHTIQGFTATGGIVLACNLAFGFSIRPQVGKATGLTGDALDKKAREYLLPGVILMPSGVFALIAAQQAGCGLCAALVPSMTGAS